MSFDSQGLLDVGISPEETPTEQVTLTGNKSADHDNERADKETRTLGSAAFVDDRSIGRTATEQQTFE